MNRDDLELQVLHNMFHAIRLKWICPCLVYMFFDGRVCNKMG